MTQKSLEPTTPPTPSRRFRFTGSHVATAAMFLIVVFMWKDLNRTKKTAVELYAQNQQMAASKTQTETELEEAKRQLDQFKTGDMQAANQTGRTPMAAPKPAEVPETLFLQEPTVRQTEDGLAARFEFKPDDISELPERITLVVRVPSASEAKILALAPVAETGNSNLECVVNAKGNLAMIEGSPAELAALVFEVTVSEPVKATVRGSKGIKAFEMDITPAGCTVRKL